MRSRALVLAACLGLLATTASAQTTSGLNFRSTSAFVTDGTGESPVLGEAYPHTYGNGLVAGFTAGAINLRDRSTSVDRRLAGINFGTTPITFRIDLPSTGSWTIRLAMGDESSQQLGLQVVVKDNTTVLDTIPASPATTAIDHFLDTGGNDRTAAAWPGSNVTKTYSFATTTAIFVFSSTATNAVVAHLAVISSGGGGGCTPTLTLLGIGRCG